jgi:hypothetical protein
LTEAEIEALRRRWYEMGARHALSQTCTHPARFKYLLQRLMQFFDTMRKDDE